MSNPNQILKVGIEDNRLKNIYFMNNFFCVSIKLQNDILTLKKNIIIE